MLVLLTVSVAVIVTVSLPMLMPAGLLSQKRMLDHSVRQPAPGICGKDEKRRAIRQHCCRFRKCLLVRIAGGRMLEPDNIHPRRHKLYFDNGAIHCYLQLADPVFMGMVMSFCRGHGLCLQRCAYRYDSRQKRNPTTAKNESVS